MSEWKVEVVRLGACEKHPNADSLSITRIHGGYPVIFRTADRKEGDLAVYVPIDSVVPHTPEWEFLGRHKRIKAKRLRGVFSMGLLGDAPPGVQEGDDVAELMGIVRWEADAAANLPPWMGVKGPSNAASPPKGFTLPVYDIEGLRRYMNILEEGEEVVITEKIHGCNARFVHDGTELFVGSRNQYKKAEDDRLWWPVAQQYRLDEILARHPLMAIYGEVYGQVQDLNYGIEEGAKLAIFDVYDVKEMRWLDFEEAYGFVDQYAGAGLSWVPILYRGAWSRDKELYGYGGDVSTLLRLANGKSTLADHMREGFVVRPVKERWNDRCGRVQFKYVSEEYLTRE